MPAALGVTIAALAGGAAGPATVGDDWPRYAHDGALTGRSPLAGRITKPAAAWQYSVAGRELLLEVLPQAGEHRLAISVTGELPTAGEQAIAPPGPLLLDLDGSGAPRPAVESSHERWAKILTDVKGMQRIAWNHTWTDQKVCRLQLFTYDEGFDKPRLVWQTDPPEDTIFNPLDVVFDIDGDGVLEVCVAAHYRVMIFEGTTGRKETELRYHQNRPYGWFGLADVDADGQMELVTIGDFQSHVDVLSYDPSRPEPQRLSVKWRRDIEQNIEERRKWPQVGPRPVVDVTGDGRPDIVLNLFNDTGDGQWHVAVIEGATGRVMHDLPQRFVQGAADLDADRTAELFLASTQGVLVPAFGRAELVEFRDGAPTVLWSGQHAGWAMADLPHLGPTWSTSAAQGMRHVIVAENLAGGGPAFLLMERPASSDSPSPASLVAMRLGMDSRPTVIWRVEGFAGLPEPIALAGVGEAPRVAEAPGVGKVPSVGGLVRCRLPAGASVSLLAHGAQPRVVAHRPLGGPASMPVAGRLRPGGPMTVVVEGAAENIFAIEAPTGPQAAPRLAWQRPGRGMAEGSRSLGPLLADLDGDGGYEVIVADQTSRGEALLIACRHDGTTWWQVPFDEIPGHPPIWNLGALTFWWPGHFRRSDEVDLFVNTRRGLMHSDVGLLLDGRSGAVVWRQEKAAVEGKFTWAYAGSPPAVVDLNGDGLDELISLHPVCFWIADGKTGRLTVGEELASRKKLPAWAAYGEPMVHDFSGGGTRAVLLDSPYILALLDTEGTPQWHGLGRDSYPTSTTDENAGQTTSVKHALADVDGDGVFEVASAGYGDGVRAIDPRDGRVLWSVAARPPTCSRVVAANIDGQGGDDILYPSNDTLVAVSGDRTGGRVLWEWRGPASLSMPAIADTDADGQAELIIQAADGTVHVLDSER